MKTVTKRMYALCNTRGTPKVLAVTARTALIQFAQDHLRPAMLVLNDEDIEKIKAAMARKRWTVAKVWVTVTPR